LRGDLEILSQRGARILGRVDPSFLQGRYNFVDKSPNQLWVTDLTYVPTWSGVAYVCFVTDAFSRMTVGWRVGRTCGPRWRSTRQRWPAGHVEKCCAGRDITLMRDQSSRLFVTGQGALAKYQPPTWLPRRRPARRARSHLLRYKTVRPSPERNPIARISIRARAIQRPRPLPREMSCESVEDKFVLPCGLRLAV
jgi:transposase InsO family protein